MQVGMKNSIGTHQPYWYIGGLLLAVTIGHYLFPPQYGLLHNVLQRLYYIPIIWSAYAYGKKGGFLASTISAVVYLPHILMSWKPNPEYQLNQLLEVLLFVLIGTPAGMLFEQKVRQQKMLQSYEKMAMFGSLSRSVIRSLKVPVKVIKGMLISLEPMARRNAGLDSCISIISEEIDQIENVRSELISLVERKKLRLKKQNLNKVMFDFAGEIEQSLRLRNITLTRMAAGVNLAAYCNKKALTNALHHLVGAMVDANPEVKRLKLYTGESATNLWLGATVGEIQLDSYFSSSLSYLDTDNYPNYDLISVVNTINNHFGDVRFRWTGDKMTEFIFVFPKKLKLPWYLKDNPTRQPIGRGDKPGSTVPTLSVS